MAEATLNAGATSLADANWSDGSGFDTADAELAILGSTAAITGGLDQNDEVIDYLRILGGAPRFGGLVTVAYRAASTRVPSFEWQCAGTIQIAFAGANDCEEVLINGGTVAIEDGEIGNWIRVVSGTVSIRAGADFGASCELIVDGGNVIIEASSGSDVLPTLTINGGRVETRRTITTINGDGGTVEYDGPAAPTTVNNRGMVYRPRRNAGTTYNQSGRGVLDTNAIKVATTIATGNFRSGAVPGDDALLTITARNTFGAQAIQTGPPLFI